MAKRLHILHICPTIFELQKHEHFFPFQWEINLKAPPSVANDNLDSCIKRDSVTVKANVIFELDNNLS